MRLFLILTLLAGCSGKSSTKSSDKPDVSNSSTATPKPRQEGALERLLREQEKNELEPFQPTPTSTTVTNTTIITIVNVPSPMKPASNLSTKPKSPSDLSIDEFRFVGFMGNFLVFQERGGSYSEITGVGQLVGNTGARVTSIDEDGLGGAMVTLEKDGQSFTMRTSAR